jgi:hypothetical protein
MTSTDQAKALQELTKAAIADAKKAAAKGEEAVVFVVLQWATRAFCAESGLAGALDRALADTEYAVEAERASCAEIAASNGATVVADSIRRRSEEIQRRSPRTLDPR